MPARLTSRQHLALNAAKLYHLHGLDQAAVAEHLHVSRSNVSKLLATARSLGFVRTLVLDPRESDRGLVDAFTQRFTGASLRMVVPVGSGPADRLRAVASGAAQLLAAAIVPEEEDVALWWSQATAPLAAELERAGARPRALVQAGGCLTEVIPADLAAAAAHGPTPIDVLPTPALHPSVTARLDAQAEPSVRRVLTRAERCEVLVHGSTSADDEDLLASPLLSPAEREEIRERTVGQLCGRFIDAEGRVVAPAVNQRICAPSLAHLRRLKRSVLLAADPAQAGLIRSALQHRYVNQLVADVSTVQALLEE